MKNPILLVILTLFVSAVNAEESDNSTPFVTELEKNYNLVKERVCQRLDLTVNITDSPLIYTDPDASCDLGFKMPGLPDFNIGLNGLDSCKILKSITSDTVDAFNSGLQDAVDEGLSAVGGNNDVIIDIGDIIGVEAGNP